MGTSVILLNADYTFLNLMDWKKAICLLAKGKAKVLKYGEKFVRNFTGTVKLQLPIVMILLKFIRTLYKTRVPFAKRNVIVRDGFTCAYCGTKSKNLTIDHIVPKSRGGKSSFENCVASCVSCNSKKGRKTPSEANMFLNVKPVQPTISEFLRLKMENLGVDGTLRELGVY